MNTRFDAYILILVMMALCFTGRFGCDLWTPDEPREAAISLEMSRDANYIIPELAGKPFVEKPPLYYIFTSFSIKSLGPYIGDTDAIRLISILFGVGTLVMTFLLARLFFGQTAGLLAAAMLAVMPGFVETFNWIRSDAALCFFVIAAIWCFAEVYVKKRPWFCVPAGLFSAGAFLSKGPIGPVLIAIPWFGLVFLWIRDLKTSKFKRSDLYILPHFICLSVFLLLSGIWVYLLRKKGGEALWYQWFWVNQVGRLLGEANAEAKGHIRTGKPFYYLNQTAVYTIPWLPLLAVWVWDYFRDIFKRRRLSKESVFLFVWGAGSLVLLSISATKRGIYMEPVLPALALMCVAAWKKIADNKAIKGYFLFWTGFCAVILAVLTCLPFLTPLFSHKISIAAADFLEKFGIRNILAGIGFLACVYFCVLFKREKMNAKVVFIATALAYLGLFVLPVKAIDIEKSMKSDIINFVARIPKQSRPHIVAYNFTETMQGNFYYYCDWPVRQTDDVKQLQRILAGKDPKFDSIIIDRDRPQQEAIDFMNNLLKTPYRIIEEKYTGGKRGIFWITGKKSITNYE